MEQKPEMKFEERNATLDEEIIPEHTNDDLQEELLDEAGMNGFQKYIARMEDQKWIMAQWITGGILGAVAAVALFWDSITNKIVDSTGSIFSVPLVIAIVVAMIVPNIIEKQGLRRAPKLRIAECIVLVVAIIVFMIYTAVTKGFH